MKYVVKDNLIINKFCETGVYLNCTILDTEKDLGVIKFLGVPRYKIEQEKPVERTVAEIVVTEEYKQEQQNKRKKLYKEKTSDIKEELIYLQAKLDASNIITENKLEKINLTEDEKIKIMIDIEKLKLEIVKQQDNIKKQIPKTW